MLLRLGADSRLCSRRDVLVASGAVGALAALTACRAVSSAPKRLTIEDGGLLWAGRPFSALGAVIYQLQDYFVAGGQSGSSESFSSFPYDPGRGALVLREAARYGLHVARIMSMGENPTWLHVWQSQPTVFWRGHDAMMETAARYGIYLIPSLVWWPLPFAQATGNTNAEVFQRGTQGYALMMRWVREYVSRYARHPSVLMWELGNEWNLSVTEGGATSGMFGKGTPYFQTFAGLRTAMADLVATIKGIDPLHLVESGWASPASFAAPTVTLQQKMFVETNQEVDVASLHIYPPQGSQAVPPGLAALYKNAAAQMHIPAPHATGPEVKGIFPVASYLQAMAQAARQRLHKPVIVGEFGENLVVEPQASFLRAVLASWAQGTIPLALVWDWMAHAGDHNSVDPYRRPTVADLFRSYARKHPWPTTAKSGGYT